MLLDVSPAACHRVGPQMVQYSVLGHANVLESLEVRGRGGVRWIDVYGERSGATVLGHANVLEGI